MTTPFQDQTQSATELDWLIFNKVFLQYLSTHVLKETTQAPKQFLIS